ncbi:MAG: winged helix-turn-helix domain-containing protein [Phycisphaerales bacterium]|nr:winged helix-turn-helix domain-containing protein [Phycisphaerales bacterium]
MNRPRLALMWSVRLMGSREPANKVHELRSQAMATKKTDNKSGKKKTASARRGTTNTTKSSKTATSAPAAAKQSKSRPANEYRPKRVSGLDMAAEVLAKSEKPLNAKAIAERVIAAGWKTDGKTPHATLYSAIIREITTKKNASRFRKADRGQFVAAKGAM